MKSLTVLMVLFRFFAQGQVGSDTIFLDKKLNKCSRDTFTYFRLAQKQNDMFSVRDYYRSGMLQSEGTYLSLDPEVMNGFFTFYFESGYKKADGEYNKNKRQGTFRFYADTTGMLMFSTVFENNKMNGSFMLRDTGGNITTGTYADNRLASLITTTPNKDSSLSLSETIKKNYRLVFPDSLHRMSYKVNIDYELDSLGEPVNIITGKNESKALANIVIQSIRELNKSRVSKVNYHYHPNAKFSIVVTFPDMNISQSVTDGKIFKSNSFTVHNVLPKDSGDGQFELRDNRWVRVKTLSEYFREKFIKTKIASDTAIRGLVMIKFEVGANNKPDKIEVLWGQNKQLNNFTIKQIRKYKKWTSEFSKGKPVIKVYRVSIDFPKITVISNSNVKAE